MHKCICGSYCVSNYQRLGECVGNVNKECLRFKERWSLRRNGVCDFRRAANKPRKVLDAEHKKKKETKKAF